MSKRLLVIVLLGIVLVGAVYWYTSRPPEAPPRPPARPRPVARPQAPQPPTPVTPPVAKPEAVKPPTPVQPPAPERKEAQVRPQVPEPKVSPEAPTKGPEDTPELSKPAETPREVSKGAVTRPEPEKPAPQTVAKTTVPQVEPKRSYSVQVASLVVERNAHSLKARLEKLGYEPTIQRKTARITRHRVYAGQFPDREEADQTARRLTADGFSPKLVEGEHGQFAVEVGWFFKQDDAIDLARRLEQKNYTSKIVPKTAPTPVYVVRVGEYEKKSDALPFMESLKRKGFAPFVVRR